MAEVEARVALQGIAGAQAGDDGENSQRAEEVVEAGRCHLLGRPLHEDSRERIWFPGKTSSIFITLQLELLIFCVKCNFGKLESVIQLVFFCFFFVGQYEHLWKFKPKGKQFSLRILNRRIGSWIEFSNEMLFLATSSFVISSKFLAGIQMDDATTLVSFRFLSCH